MSIALQETNLSIVHLPLDLIVESPFQKYVRAWSQKYEAWVDEAKADELVRLIAEKGYDESDPVLVRPIGEGRYEYVKGHTRSAACKAIQRPTIPSVVRELDDKEAAILLVTGQGKGLELWAMARHAYQCCKAYGGEGLMSVSEYAKLVGKEQPTISNWVAAAELKEAIAQNSDTGISAAIHSSEFSVTAAREIASLPRADWGWFTTLHFDKSWNERQRMAAIKAIKEVQDLKVPDELLHWLSLEKWKRDAAIESTEAPQPQVVNNLRRLVRVATTSLQSLPIERPVWRFNGAGEPYREALPLQTMFLNDLPQKATPPTEAKVKAIVAGLLEMVSALDSKYKQWQATQQSLEETQKAQEEIALARLQMEAEYSPTGFKASIRQVNLELDWYDAALTYYPANNLIDRWVPLVADSLKPGGFLICPCLGDDIFALNEEVTQSDLIYLETLIWLRTDTAPTERWASGYEFIYVAYKPGLIPYFDREMGSHPDVFKTAGAVVEGEIPLALAESLLKAYVPEKGCLLNPFAETSVFTRAAKRLGYKATWIEADPVLFAKAESLIEATPFEWEP